MKSLVGCALLPHLPAIISEVGGCSNEQLCSSRRSVEQVAQALVERGTETVVLITPHGAVFEDAVSVSVYPRLRGSLAAYGAADISVAFETDGLLVRHILRRAERLGINYIELTDDVAKSRRLPLELDYGAVIPLYFLHKAGFKGQLVHLSAGLSPYEELYTFGKAVQGALAAVDRRTAVIASAALGHRSAQACGNRQSADEFDGQIMDALAGLNVKALLAMDKQLIADAGECGLRSIFFLFGVLGGMEATASLLSYEAPQGTGCGVALFTPPPQKEKSKPKLKSLE
ncbi:MAG: class III extradiol dioxygenase subunit B-like domain-containing protein [Sporomusaceae bacterium]|nr:class III extradiol dioxygenase subunit B-like domain-containing protein [Sporomusaceae bacterium]